MTKFRKATFGFLLSAVVLLVSWLIVGSIDKADFDDRGLLGRLSFVPDEKNGYREIAFTQKEGFELLGSEELREELRQHVYRERWHQDFVEAATSSRLGDIERANSVVEYENFKLPVGKEIGSLPNYIPIMDLSRLLILHSMQKARLGEIDEAIELAKDAVGFSQKIKTEENQILISHMIGYVMLYESLEWVHSLATDYALTATQYDQLLDLLEKVPGYRNDEFSLVFSGEFLFSVNLLESVSARSLSQRLSDYRSGGDWWVSGRSSDSAAAFALRWTELILPEFYIHKNEVLGETAKRYSELSEASKSYCDAIALPDKPSEYVVEWADLLEPNLLGDLSVRDPSAFNEYFVRRCLWSAYIESKRAIVAIMKYRLIEGGLPELLGTLVPEYLPQVPVDPFDGGELRYSQENAYLYSLGSDFKDDGGSQEGMYVRSCDASTECSRNPTFPIFPERRAEGG